MTSEDALQVATVHTLSWQQAYRGIVDQSLLDSLDIQKRAESWEKGIRSNEPNLLRLVAEQEGKVIAFACGLANRSALLIPTSDCELWAIYSHPLVYRRGAGRLLLDEFKTEMKRLGYQQFCVWTLAGNRQAQSFYESLGGRIHPTTREIKIGEQALPEVAYEFSLS